MVQVVVHRRHPDRFRPRNRAPTEGPDEAPSHFMWTHSAVRPVMATGSPTRCHTSSGPAPICRVSSTYDTGRRYQHRGPEPGADDPEPVLRPGEGRRPYSFLRIVPKRPPSGLT